MKKLKTTVLSFLVGVINAIFGAGGGIIAVSLFKFQGLEQKKAQAAAVCMILPLSLLSAVLYYLNGHFSLNEASKYIPFGIVGTLIGTRLLGKIPDKLLKKLFSIFMIYTGIRLIMR